MERWLGLKVCGQDVTELHIALGAVGVLEQGPYLSVLRTGGGETLMTTPECGRQRKSARAQHNWAVHCPESQRTRGEPRIAAIEVALAPLIEPLRLAMLRAERSATVLHKLSVTFFVFAVVAPPLAGYLSHNYIPTYHVVISEQRDHAVASEQRARPPEQDWHLLLACLSYGFLCLASGRAMLYQEAKQRQAYFRYESEHSRYERLVAAVTLASRCDDPGETSRVNAIVDTVLHRLTESPESDDKEPPEQYSQDPPVKAAGYEDLVKATSSALKS